MTIIFLMILWTGRDDATMMAQAASVMRALLLWLLVGRVASVNFYAENSIVAPSKPCWLNKLERQTNDEPSHFETSKNSKVPTSAVRNELTRFWKDRQQCRFPAPIVLGTASCIVLVKTLRSEPVRRAFYFWRHAGLIVAHYKFTQWWLASSRAPVERRSAVYEKLHDRYAEPSLAIMIHLKGLYVKVGQVLSSRPDFIPDQYVGVFATVQDSIPPWPVDQVQAIIDKSYGTVFGLSFDDVFESIDEDALGSASIGQVHRAVLKERWIGLHHGVSHVAVKVMHPNAKQRFVHDFSVFRWLCRLVLPEWKGLLNELERQFMTEFDYRTEAIALRDVRNNMMQSAYSSRVVVPEPLEDLCSKHVLVMEMLKGKKLATSMEDNLTAVFGGDKDRASALLAARQKEILFGDASGISEQMLASASLYEKCRLLLLHQKYKRFINLLVDVHGHQIFVDGCFNGDAHPGNCLDVGDGRLGLIDYGQTRRLDDNDRIAFARVIVEVSRGTNTTAIADSMRKSGFATSDPDDKIMVKYANIFFDSDLEAKRLGFATPQQYFASLMMANRLTCIPDAAGKYCFVQSSVWPKLTHSLTQPTITLLFKCSLPGRAFCFGALTAPLVRNQCEQHNDGRNTPQRRSQRNNQSNRYSVASNI